MDEVGRKQIHRMQSQTHTQKQRVGWYGKDQIKQTKMQTGQAHAVAYKSRQLMSSSLNQEGEHEKC